MGKYGKGVDLLRWLEGDAEKRIWALANVNESGVITGLEEAGDVE